MLSQICYIIFYMLLGIVFVIFLSAILICLFIACLEAGHTTRKLKEATKQIEKMTQEMDRMRNSMVTNDFKCFDGIFEIHITIDPECNYVKLLGYVSQHEKQKGMKIVFAVSSQKNNQYMLSYFTRKTDDRMAIDAAIQVAKELEELEIKILRVKIEGHNCIGTPQTTEDYKIVLKYLQNKYAGMAGTPYFEFHVKVSNANDITELEFAVSQFKGTSVSYNLCSAEKKPILTIRVYGKGFIDAVKYKDEIMNSLKERGYVFENKIQEEFSIYDSNSGVDSGWLITS